jgi:hypothetical protein
VFYESKTTRNRISSSVWNYSVKDGAEDDCESKMSESPAGLQKLSGKRIVQSSQFMQYKFANMNPGVKGFASNRKFSEFYECKPVEKIGVIFLVFGESKKLIEQHYRYSKETQHDLRTLALVQPPAR